MPSTGEDGDQGDKALSILARARMAVAASLKREEDAAKPAPQWSDADADRLRNMRRLGGRRVDF